MDLLLIRDKLENKLSPKRFEHSIGVEYTSAAMAMTYGIDVNIARYAGILHDCAKYLDNDTKIKKCLKHNIPISDFELENPELLHAKLSAYYAKKKYDILDEDILSAITYHTTGRPNMNTLEKIIFIADYIEPNRKPLNEIDLIRKEAFVDLDICIAHILKNTIEYLVKNNAIIDNISIETYKYYNKGVK